MGSASVDRERERERERDVKVIECDRPQRIREEGKEGGLSRSSDIRLSATIQIVELLRAQR